VESELSSLSDYVVVLRRHRRLLAIVTVAGIVAGGLLTLVMPKTYEAEATVLVRPQGVELSRAFDDDTVVDLETASRLARSRTVAERTSQALAAGGIDRSASALVAASSVQPGLSDILDFRVRDGSPAVAAAAATAMAEQYLAFAREQLDRSIAEATADLQQTLVDAEARLAEVDGAIAATTDDAARSVLQSERTLLLAQINEIQRSLVDARSLVRTPGEIVDTAEVPAAPSSPKLLVNLVLGLVLGLVAGVAVAFLRERSSDRLTTESTLSDDFGLRLLGSVPGGRSRLGRAGPPPLLLPGSAGGERYRRILAGMVHAIGGAEGGRVVLLVTPVDPGVTAGVAANLALFAANAGYRVDLVQTDLRYPSLHHYFRLPAAPGAADVLRAHVAYPDVARGFPEVPGLRIVTAGSVNLEASRLVQPRALRHLLDSARLGTDLVLIDSPPMAEVADAVVLADLADAVVLVVDPARSRRREVEVALADLRRGGVEPDGVIVLGGGEGSVRAGFPGRAALRPVA
jgi:Mrp family chromosome partitioning ATPase